MNSITNMGINTNNYKYVSTNLNTVEKTSNDDQNKISLRLEGLTQSVERDEDFAEEMAKVAAFIPDKLLVDLNDLPPLNDIEAHKDWNKKFTDFDLKASKVTSQRIEIYNEMKLNDSSDESIFKAILEFNKTLPIDYQLESGLRNLNIKA